MRCDKVEDAVYAEGIECQDLPESFWYFSLFTRAVSTNFDPVFYNKYGAYQLYSKDIGDSYRSS